VNIRFCGFGGQGILVAGRILGMAAANAGRNALQNQAYGSASRGGTCYSDVTISDEDIYELEPHEFDVLIALSQQACDKFLPLLKKGGLLITDKDLVQLIPGQDEGFQHHSLSATDRAHHQFGRDILANIIMIGLLNNLAGILDDGIIEEAITTVVPEGSEEINITAYRLGKELAAKINSI
jgi:2-oxoglutarate ferredoxin oxidoreductase subunit gamma